jgi:hypothetical protein
MTMGSVTHSIFVRFTSNFVHLHPAPLQELVMSLTPLFLHAPRSQVCKGEDKTWSPWSTEEDRFTDIISIHHIERRFCSDSYHNIGMTEVTETRSGRT